MLQAVAILATSAMTDDGTCADRACDLPGGVRAGQRGEGGCGDGASGSAMARSTSGGDGTNSDWPSVGVRGDAGKSF